MKIYYTDALGTARNDPLQANLIYNGLDTLVTYEVWQVLSEMLEADPIAKMTYDFTFAMLAPAFIMQRRGIAVDPAARVEATLQYQKIAKDRIALLERLSHAAVGVSIMAKKEPSKEKMKKLFYGSMELPVQYALDKATKEKKVTVNRDALEKLQEFLIARPFIALTLDIRDANKKLSVLRAPLDADNRMRFSYNPAGTSTGRWSSYENVVGGGTNGQNLTELIRRIFRPSEGLKFGNMDLKQAEAKCVAYNSADLKYIEACLSSDIHTYVARLCFPDYPWTGDNRKDRELAETIKVYRHFTIRDMAKRGAHATNYVAKPYALHKNIKIPVGLATDFQTRYFSVFVGVREYHFAVRRELVINRSLVTAAGRRLRFFGHPQSDDTLKQAVAGENQSLSGDILNMALYRMMELDEWLHPSPWRFRLLAQIHDAVLYEFDPQYEVEVQEKVRQLSRVPILVRDREMTLEPEVSSGWNWGKFNKKENIYGLREWTGRDDRDTPPPAAPPTAEQLLSVSLCN